MTTRLVETWRAAREDSCNGELTFRQWGDYKRRHVTHGWWVNPDSWGIGLSVTHEAPTPSYGGRTSLTVEAGPFTWGISLVHPQLPHPPEPLTFTIAAGDLTAGDV